MSFFLSQQQQQQQPSKCVVALCVQIDGSHVSRLYRTSLMLLLLMLFTPITHSNFSHTTTAAVTSAKFSFSLTPTLFSTLLSTAFLHLCEHRLILDAAAAAGAAVSPAITWRHLRRTQVPTMRIMTMLSLCMCVLCEMWEMCDDEREQTVVVVSNLSGKKSKSTTTIAADQFRCWLHVMMTSVFLQTTSGHFFIFSFFVQSLGHLEEKEQSQYISSWLSRVTLITRWQVPLFYPSFILWNTFFVSFHLFKCLYQFCSQLKLEKTLRVCDLSFFAKCALLQKEPYVIKLFSFHHFTSSRHKVKIW